MRAVLSVLAVLWASFALGANPATRPAGKVATRPASAPASRPADAPLSPQRRGEFNRAMTALSKETNPQVHAAREALKERAENKTLDYEGDQARHQQKAGEALRRGILQGQRGHRKKELKQEGKLRNQQRKFEQREAVREESVDDRAQTFKRLDCLEEVWRACRRYQISAEYEQWGRAASARADAEKAMMKVNKAAYPPRFQHIVKPAEAVVEAEWEKFPQE